MSKINPFLVLIIVLSLIYGADFLLGSYFNKRQINSFRTSHYLTHHGILPSEKGLASWAYIKYPFYSNSIGGRDTAIRKVSNAPRNKRLIIIGDSHSEGVGVWVHNTFPFIIQEMAQKDIEILNASAVSFSPKLYYYRILDLIRNYGIKTDGVHVMLDLSDIQNEIVYGSFEPDSSPKKRKIQKMHEFHLKHSFVYFRIQNIVRKLRMKRFIEITKNFEEYSENTRMNDALEMYSGFFDQFEDEILAADPNFHKVGEWLYRPEYKTLIDSSLNSSRHYISLLKDLCDENQINLSLSVHPWDIQISRQDTSDFWVESWRDFCQKMDIGFLNLYPAFINPPIPASLGNDFFIPGDNHWNEKGHRIVALQMGEFLGLK